jgi:surface antigen
MKNFLYLIFILSLSTGCSNSTWNSTKIMGILGGGAGGYSAYALGSEMVGSEYGIPIALAGTLLGAFIGSEIGDNLDENRSEINLALDNNINQSQTWYDPQDNKRETIIPKERFISKNNDECRKFNWEVEDSGSIKRGSGVACKNSNGDWETLGSTMM